MLDEKRSNLMFQSPREYTEHERRQLLIARLPNVETLNGGGVVSSQEREDAERAFIRYYMDKPEADRPERCGSPVSWPAFQSFDPQFRSASVWFLSFHFHLSTPDSRLAVAPLFSFGAEPSRGTS